MNRYKVKWKDILQPYTGHSWQDCRQYVINQINAGSALNDFQIMDKWGIINTAKGLQDPEFNPELTTNYTKLF